MNPNIRYQQGYTSTFSHNYTSDRINDNSQITTSYRRQDNINRGTYQRKLSQDIVYQNDLSRHKNTNLDIRPYLNNNLPMSYRLDPNSTQKEASHYKSTHNFYRQNDIQKNQTANDFFNEVASQISQKPPAMQKVISKTYNEIQSIKSVQNITKNPSLKQEKKLSFEEHQSETNECSKCKELELQIQKVFKFMRQQLQISIKQYSDKMNKIIFEQAKQIMDLRKSLVNNEKNLIKFEKQSYMSQFNSHGSILSPGKSHVKNRSPSKLTLTKSNTSISPHHSHKQKITMVSKQLSPSKNYLKNLQKNPSAQTPSNQQMISTSQGFSSTSYTIQELIMKIRNLQQKIQITYKIDNERNEKILMMNKRIEVIEKGVLSIFSGRIQRVKQKLRQWMGKQQERQNSLYRQMKVISSRMGTLSGSSNMLMNSHSSPLISQIRQQAQSPQLTSHKTLVKLKKFASQIEDLRQILTNLQTRQFKYDNYQIDTLAQDIERIKSKLYQLEKQKQKMLNKVAQRQEILDQAIIDVSRHSHSKISSSNHNSSKNIEHQPSNKSFKNINITGNKSVQLTYLNKNQSMNQMGTKSMKMYEMGNNNEGSKLTKYTKFTSQNYNNFQPHSHSEYKGFSGKESQFSQFMDQSGLNRNREYNNNNEQDYESSVDEGSSQNEQEDEDEFFYPVDLSSGQRQQVNGLRVSASNKRMMQKENQEQYPSPTIHRFMQVIEYRNSIPLRVEIDQTGYIKSAQNGMYIVDRNMDGFDLDRNELDWLKQRGIIIIQH